MSNDPRLKTLLHRLLVWDHHDNGNLPQRASSFSKVPNQDDVVLLAGCGHWAQCEQVAKFNDLVLWFLQRA